MFLQTKSTYQQTYFTIQCAYTLKMKMGKFTTRTPLCDFFYWRHSVGYSRKSCHVSKNCFTWWSLHVYLILMYWLTLAVGEKNKTQNFLYKQVQTFKRGLKITFTCSLELLSYTSLWSSAWDGNQWKLCRDNNSPTRDHNSKNGVL